MHLGVGVRVRVGVEVGVGGQGGGPVCLGRVETAFLGVTDARAAVAGHLNQPWVS